MRIMLTEMPGENGYIESLINAYRNDGHEVLLGAENFFDSRLVPDVLHIHWPYRWNENTLGSEEGVVSGIKQRLEWYKTNSTVVVYTVHNLEPHESPASLNSSVFNLIAKHADTRVHHCAKSILDAVKFFDA